MTLLALGFVLGVAVVMAYGLSGEIENWWRYRR